VIKAYELRLLTLPYQYGGPHTLAKYKCFVHIPYQTSIMKLTENLHAGKLLLLLGARGLK
jgi:hypothetical protein